MGDCWASIDDLYVMANGRLAYYGPAKNVNSWLKKTGYAAPPESNPGDHLIRTIDDTFEDFSHKVCSLYPLTQTPRLSRHPTLRPRQSIHTYK